MVLARFDGAETHEIGLPIGINARCRFRDWLCAKKRHVDLRRDPAFAFDPSRQGGTRSGRIDDHRIGQLCHRAHPLFMKRRSTGPGIFRILDRYQVMHHADEPGFFALQDAPHLGGVREVVRRNLHQNVGGPDSRTPRKQPCHPWEDRCESSLP